MADFADEEDEELKQFTDKVKPDLEPAGLRPDLGPAS
jgi:hypothetical protein